MKKIINQSAFTLIELMVVVAIIAILATLGISSYSTAIKKSRDASRKSDIQNIAQALVLYRSDEEGYPASTANLVPNYMSAVPKDEKTGVDYKYTTSGVTANGKIKKFALCTASALEFPKGNANSTSNTALTNGTTVGQACSNTGEASSTCVYYCAASP